MRMARRERIMVALMAVAIALGGGFKLFIEPAMDRVAMLERTRGPRQQELRKLEEKSREYLALQERIGRLRRKVEQQPEGFAILSFLERLGQECGLADRVVNMRPTTMPVREGYAETTVAVSMEQVSLEQITRFLLGVESAEALIGVKSIEIRTARRDRRYLDADVQVATLAPAGGAPAGPQTAALR